MKRKLKILITLICALALIATGTFAWEQIITAKNEFIGDKAPVDDVTLHDDFDPGSNKKDVYAENTGDVTLYLRVKLDEAMSLTNNKWRPGAQDWATHVYGETAEDCGLANQASKKYHDHFDWTMGGWKYYKSTDGSRPLVQDTMEYTEAQYNDPASGVKKTPNAQIITSEDFLAMAEEQQKAFQGWIYSTDGYAYWSQPLKSGEATGLLLHGVRTSDSIKGTEYYYVINVTLEVVDIDDIPMWTEDAQPNGGGDKHPEASTDGKEVIVVIIGDGEPGDGEPGDGEPGDGEPGDGEPGDSDLEELIDLIREGEQILAGEPNPYTPESLKELEDAVNNGKAVLETDDPTEEDIKKAVDDLKDALNNLETQPTLPVLPPIAEAPTVAEDGRILTTDKTGDTADWIEIARNGGYSLIVRADFININANSMGQPLLQSPSYGANNNYQGSLVQKSINDWFNDRSTGDNLSGDARMRDYTVSNDALIKLGTGCSETGGLTNGFSKPSGQVQSSGNDIAFALSFTEAANFISKTYAMLATGGTYGDSSAAAAANFNMLTSYGPAFGVWLRSPGTSAGAPGIIQDSLGSVFQFMTNNGALIYPALWVNSAIFND